MIYFKPGQAWDRLDGHKNGEIHKENRGCIEAIKRTQEAGGRRQEAGGRRQEAGGRRQEAGGLL